MAGSDFLQALVDSEDFLVDGEDESSPGALFLQNVVDFDAPEASATSGLAKRARTDAKQPELAASESTNPSGNGNSSSSQQTVPMLVDEIAGMPQTTRLSVEKPSNRPAKYKTYNKNNFVSAVADVNDNNVSCAEAAKKWSVNGRTLQEHIAKLRKGIPIRKAGAPTTLTATEEQSIENWAKLCGLLGFPATKRSVIAKAQQILKTRNASFKSKTGRASRSWWRSFRKRHPGVKYVRPKALKRELAAVTREAIQSFYVELNRVRNLYSIRDDMVFNLDETGVSRLGEDDSKVLVDKDSDAVRITLEFRQHVSVVLCVNAQGVAMPPLFLYKGVEGLKPAHLESLQKGAIHGSQFAQTGKAYMTRETFHAWLQFFVGVHKPTPDNRALIILDNHDSRYSLDMLEYAHQHNVLLLALPPNCTPWLQPLDVSVNGSFKMALKEVVGDFTSTGATVNKQNVCGLLSDALRKSLTVSNIKSGFAKTGIVPYKPEVVLDTVMPKIANVASSLSTAQAQANVLIQQIPDHLKDILYVPKPGAIVVTSRRKKRTDKARLLVYREIREEMLGSQKPKRKQRKETGIPAGSTFSAPPTLDDTNDSKSHSSGSSNSASSAVANNKSSVSHSSIALKSRKTPNLRVLDEVEELNDDNEQSEHSDSELSESKLSEGDSSGPNTSDSSDSEHDDDAVPEEFLSDSVYSENDVAKIASRLRRQSQTERKRNTGNSSSSNNSTDSRDSKDSKDSKGSQTSTPTVQNKVLLKRSTKANSKKSTNAPRPSNSRAVASAANRPTRGTKRARSKG